jgi:hypothetical protein
MEVDGQPVVMHMIITGYSKLKSLRKRVQAPPLILLLSHEPEITFIESNVYYGFFHTGFFSLTIPLS